MKSLKPILPVFVLAFVVTRCSQDYGKEYKLDDRHNVYYKGEGVDESLARELAMYLKEQEYFQDSIKATVQLVKIKDTFNINFAVDAGSNTDGFENNFLLLGAFISEMVFNNRPVTIQLTNDKLEPFKNLGYVKPIGDTTNNIP